MRVEAAEVSLATTNVSLSGMQLSCPALLFGLLQPALDRGTLELSLLLPDESVARCACAVVYVSHYGYQYLVGVTFLAFEGDGYERFRRACLDPPGPEEPTTKGSTPTGPV
jgi:hypothetical protein